MANLLETIGVKSGIINKKRFRWADFSFGDMYTFSYFNPMNRATLPFYDRTPLFIFTGFVVESRRVEGINFHYIFPRSARQRIMKILIAVREKRPRNILHLAWTNRIRKAGIDNQKDVKRMAAAYRHYNSLRIKNVRPIDPTLWARALVEVTPRFIGASKNDVRIAMEERAGRV